MQQRSRRFDAQGFRPVEVAAEAARELVDAKRARQIVLGPACDVAVAGNEKLLHGHHFNFMHNVTLKPSGQQLQVEDGETVLAAALRQGLVLPYGCKNGACGSCKGKILEGSVDYGVYQKRVLTEEEKAQGKALFCQAKPLSDLVIEARAVGAAKGIQVKTLPCRVQAIERAADDVVVLRMKLPANEKLKFLAGQFIEFLLKDGTRRSFSMANPPHDAELVELHVRRVAGGKFTEHVFEKMKARDILRFEGPLGSFWLREDSARPIVMVAGGTGFAPIKGIIEYAIAIGLTRPITLYWGARDRAGLYLDALARSWEGMLPGFRYLPVLSDPPAGEAWDGRRGLVHQAVLDDFADLSGHDAYVCGAPVMVDVARHSFTAERGLAADAFFADAFTFSIRK